MHKTFSKESYSVRGGDLKKDFAGQYIARFVIQGFMKSRVNRFASTS